MIQNSRNRFFIIVGGVIFAIVLVSIIAAYPYFLRYYLDAEKYDKFGIAKLYPTVANGRQWFSNWDNGEARNLESGSRDPFNDEFIARGDGTIAIDGHGTASMKGESPRMYIYDEARAKKWDNVEVTIYMKRGEIIKESGSQGLIIGTRSNHQDTDINPCNGATYYSRALYDGEVDFKKELVHQAPDNIGDSITAPESTRNKWDTENGQMPGNVWIGFKFITRTVDDGRYVNLELYRDMTDGYLGGKWEKIIEYKDTGGWTNMDLTELDIAKECGNNLHMKSDQILLDPGTSILVRNDWINSSLYKNFSIREISPA